MGASLDGLIGAATAMTTAQQAAEQLAGRFGTAADRFAGLDVGVARTFEKLTEGLSGYQRQIADFIVNMDNGLGRSISGLERLVKSLQDSIEDFNDRPERKG
jgi:hypothetical protein